MSKFKLLFGLAAGALLGMAFAPKKGSDLRKEFAKEFNEDGSWDATVKKNATLIGQDIAATAKEIYHDPKVQAKIAEGKKEASKLLENAKQELTKKAEELKQKAQEKIKSMNTEDAPKPKTSRKTNRSKGKLSD